MLPNVKAWHKKSKEMLKVVSINFDEKFIRGLSEVEKNMDLESSYGFDEIEFLQSTGLFGEGKEVFQGDIIHYKIEDKSNDGSPYTLRELTGYIYKEGNCMWVKVNDSEIVPLWCLEDQYVIFKILGNIYEHPHLLGED